MKKVLMLGLAALTLAACAGLTQGKSRTTGETVYDVFILHPIISTKYISRL